MLTKKLIKSRLEIKDHCIMRVKADTKRLYLRLYMSRMRKFVILCPDDAKTPSLEHKFV